MYEALRERQVCRKRCEEKEFQEIYNARPEQQMQKVVMNRETYANNASNSANAMPQQQVMNRRP